MKILCSKYSREDSSGARLNRNRKNTPHLAQNELMFFAVVFFHIFQKIFSFFLCALFIGKSLIFNPAMT